MFTRVPQPLIYAEALLAQFASLSRAADGGTLLGDFVRGVAGLSGCELSQLYLLDATHTRLGLSAECLGGILQPREAASLPADYNGEQLLQFALCQNRVVSLVGLSGSLHETSFLPARETPWQSLLCVPLVNTQRPSRACCYALVANISTCRASPTPWANWVRSCSGNCTCCNACAVRWATRCPWPAPRSAPAVTG